MTVAVEPKNNNIIIAIYNTGIKITNRGQWLRDKWNIRKGIWRFMLQLTSKEQKNSLIEYNWWWACS